jgi:ABC-type transport system substrate-binding protein
LGEAGLEDGLETTLEATPTVPVSMLEAIASQWADVGINAGIAVSEYGAFNATWADPEAPVLRMSTWSPLYDPHTLLDLVFASGGYLSRYGNGEATDLILQAAAEPDPAARDQAYRDLAALMQEDAAAVYLWNLVAHYGVAGEAAAWSPRGDEYVLPLRREG